MAGRDALLIVRRAGRKEVTNAQIKIPTAFPPRGFLIFSFIVHNFVNRKCNTYSDRKQNLSKVFKKKKGCLKHLSHRVMRLLKTTNSFDIKNQGINFIAEHRTGLVEGLMKLSISI